MDVPLAPPLVVEGLRLRYPQEGRVVLKGVDLTLRRGEVKLLLGPSGAGKSSLALTLNGLIPHQMEGDIRGRVLVNGTPTTDTTLAALTSQVGMLFQDPESQIATLTVADEVAFGMENLLVPPREMPGRISAALQRTGLQGLEGRGTSALSGGQKQRLALASTLAMGASILVLDEPTANLDPVGTSDFFNLLAHLKSEGVSVLIIEHKLDELVEQVDSIAVLDWDGKIALDGPPRRVLAEGRDLPEQLGVWLPQVCELANRLLDKGLVLEPYPVTIDEAVVALTQLVDTLGPSTATTDIQQPARSDLITVESLSYRYPQGEQALNSVNLHIQEGDFYALLGPNGSGKTTLAKHLVGLIRPQSGTITLAGKDLTRLPPAMLSREVAYVFQNPEHQFVALTVYDELAYSLRELKLPEAEVKARVERLIEEFGLEQHTRSNPFSLSQGQKRRLSVATMLALEAKVLILDEPTFGQDRENATRMMRELQRLNASGVTIVMITHDMKLVGEYARRAGVLVGGVARYDGCVAGLFADDKLLREARLDLPPVYEVSRQLRAMRGSFPLCLSVEQMVEEICSRSGISRAAASSTR
ncbi:MAG: energy-coupling factor ABC transporter ATP-binding protein [Chloroflexota bacterium]|nr:energy-coupling factor ABC transporter ATP-binding protein [Chloroflexota bacterium]